MSSPAEQYLSSVNFKLDPDHVTPEIVNEMIGIGINLLFLCLGGNGRSHIAAQMMTNFGFPSICLDLGLVYLNGLPNKAKIITSLSKMPHKYTILDKYVELRQYDNLLAPLKYENYDNFWRVDAEALCRKLSTDRN